MDTLLALSMLRGVMSGGDGDSGDSGDGISEPYNSNRPSVVVNPPGTGVTSLPNPGLTRESISTGATTSLGECACNGTPLRLPGVEAAAAAAWSDATVSVSVYGPSTASGPK